MLFLLSSCDFGNPISKEKIVSCLKKPLAKQRVLFVPNEKFSAEKLACGRYHERLAGHGFNPDLVTILNYDVPDPLRYKSKSFDMVYASGGNTFLTLARIRAGGFDDIIVHHLRRGAIYVGGSAGAHLVCGDISHVARYDEMPPHTENPHGLFEDLPVALICHYTPEREAHRRELQASGRDVRVMTDEDIWIFEI